MSIAQKSTTLSENELKRLIQARLGMAAFLTIQRQDAPLKFTAGILATPSEAATLQKRVDAILADLRPAHDLAPPETLPNLTSQPTFDQRSRTVFFEFWQDGVRRHGSLKVPQRETAAALGFFKQSWPSIGPVAARIAPAFGEVRLEITS